MSRRPTMNEVRPVAHAFLAASADEAAPEDAVNAALRLGGGTREGQTHVNLLLAHAFADILDEECPPQWRSPQGVPDVVMINAIGEEHDLAARYTKEEDVQGAPVTARRAPARVATARRAAHRA
ncbi:hypothetical protein AB0D34_08430 [Streptomyces sp. NPDC048420]|uniref:hypothetical protein n=1 Tax=Streptomyces sp. NPDC048420 TaxID=3155755 RepID=UPI00343FBAC5